MAAALIVLCHPEPRSFTAHWAGATADALAAASYDVLWSDLYGMGFQPAEGPMHYGPDRPEVFDPLKAQEAAAATGTTPADVAAEIKKLHAAELVVFHFPLWWFSPPAMLKGWFDRVLQHGGLHTVDERFDRGKMVGRRALFCVSTGSSAAESGPDGKEGDVHMLLWPAAYTLRYLGYTVLNPVIVHGVHGYHRDVRKAALEARLRQVLDRQSDVIGEIGQRPEVRSNADDDFDADGRLRPDRESVTPFIRHSSELKN